jgi:NAD-dependent dihydropyrimidine dehydrogenase PreA subunit
VPHTIARSRCTGVGDCLLVCPTAAIEWDGPVAAPAGRRAARIHPERCIDCGACAMVCPVPGAVVADWRPDLQAMPPGIPCLECATPAGDTARFCPSCRAAVAARAALEDLVLLDGPALATLVGHVGTRLLAAILRAAGEPLADRVARRLPAPQAEALRTVLATLGPVAPGDLADAHRRAVTALRRLVATRAIRYAGPA